MTYIKNVHIDKNEYKKELYQNYFSVNLKQKILLKIEKKLLARLLKAKQVNRFLYNHQLKNNEPPDIKLETRGPRWPLYRSPVLIGKGLVT